MAGPSLWLGRFSAPPPLPATPSFSHQHPRTLCVPAASRWKGLSIQKTWGMLQATQIKAQGRGSHSKSFGVTRQSGGNATPHRPLAGLAWGQGLTKSQGLKVLELPPPPLTLEYGPSPCKGHPLHRFRAEKEEGEATRWKERQRDRVL